MHNEIKLISLKVKSLFGAIWSYICTFYMKDVQSNNNFVLINKNNLTSNVWFFLFDWHSKKVNLPLKFNFLHHLRVFL